MNRNERITIYVSEEEQKHLENEADAEGETLSSYLYKLIQEQRRREGADRAATETNAEERIEALIAEGTETLEEIAADIRDMNARAGAYSVANFELLKSNYPDARRKEVLETGARRLRYPLEEHVDLSDHGDTDTAQNGESARDESDGDDDGPKGVDDLL